MEAKDFIEALIAAGMTQSEISERTGIPQPSISKVARGDVDDVLSRNYRKLQSLHAERCIENKAVAARPAATLGKVGA